MGEKSNPYKVVVRIKIHKVHKASTIKEAFNKGWFLRMKKSTSNRRLETFHNAKYFRVCDYYLLDPTKKENINVILEPLILDFCMLITAK